MGHTAADALDRRDRSNIEGFVVDLCKKTVGAESGLLFFTQNVYARLRARAMQQMFYQFQMVSGKRY